MIVILPADLSAGVVHVVIQSTQSTASTVLSTRGCSHLVVVKDESLIGISSWTHCRALVWVVGVARADSTARAVARSEVNSDTMVIVADG